MISKEELHSLVIYNKETGVFKAKVSFCDKIKAGKKLGCKEKRNGYIIIGLNGKNYFAHKLAWLYEYGEYPDLIDHIDCNCSNNSLKNLRIADKSKNAMNSAIRIDNKTGVKGITWEERDTFKGYQARIVLNGKNYTKRFSVSKYDFSNEKALEAATKWVKEQRELLHKDFTNHG